MSLNASELYEAGMNLPAAVRKDVALRLLESLEAADQDSVDTEWTTAIGSRLDDIISGRAETIPGEQVFARLAERRAARNE